MFTEERKERIRHRLRHTRYSYDITVAQLEAYNKNKHINIHERMRGKIDAGMIDYCPVYIHEDDILAGAFPPFIYRTVEEHEERNKHIDSIAPRGTINGSAPSNTGHRVIDYEKLLRKGILGVIDEVKEHLSRVKLSDSECAEKRAFYGACLDSLEAVLRLEQRYIDEAKRQLAETDDECRRGELEAMIKTLERVPAHPAQSFREAIQSVWFMQLVVQILGDSSLCGRPDNYLYPFYKRDIEAGITTDDEVFMLIEDLYFKHNNIYGSWPAAIMVGGRKRNGESNWNELSYMFVKAIETTGLVNPSVAVCYNEDMPDDLLTLCLEIIAKGYTRPSIFNDEIAIKGLREAGVSEEDANYYIHSTCVELTPIASSNIMVATPYINLNKGLEYIFNGGEKIFGNDFMRERIQNYDLATLDTFEKFYAAIKETIDNILVGELSAIQDYILYRKRYTSLPLVSCFINDCLAMGKDAANDGARYSFIYPCFPGFINLIDSVVAIRRVVYEEKRATLEEIRDAIKGNFEGEERLRAFLLNRCAKFGNDLDESDEIGKDLFLYMNEELKKFNTCVRNGSFHPSYFAWIQHGVLGQKSAATPDGRLQGEALSECLGSVQGMDKNGPVALMHSTSKIPQPHAIGGVATNFRFSKKMMRESLPEIKAFIKEFMRNGNFEAQFNVIDQETLLDALERPAYYKTLMVRVAGYSDYFVDLSPIIQREIISRLEHDEL
ncbi:MAG: hypothetical protein IKJ80_00930 [Clostridia bacterium]|nr:hypothetical protein [Clostridia bacterium]